MEYQPSIARIVLILLMLAFLFITRWIEDDHQRFQVQLGVVAVGTVLALLAP